MSHIPSDKAYKVVMNDNHNTDQYLIGFYPSEHEAEKDVPNLRTKYAKLIGKSDLFIKPTDPEMILHPVGTDYEQYNRALIPDEEWERVMKGAAWSEIDCNFMTCGTGYYYNLSKMIDKEWTVIDLGCGYNAQSYLFQDHARYIAVNPIVFIAEFGFFQAPETEFYGIDGQNFIRKILPNLQLDLNAVFCIVNYVPSEDCIKSALATFKNIWVYYPYTPKEVNNDRYECTENR